MLMDADGKTLEPCYLEFFALIFNQKLVQMSLKKPRIDFYSEKRGLQNPQKGSVEIEKLPFESKLPKNE